MTAPVQWMDILMGAYEVLVRVCLAQGDLAGAESAVRAMEDLQHSAGIPLFRPWVDGLQVRLWLAQGHLSRAADWAEHTSYRHEVPVYSREGAYLALVSLSLTQTQYAQALALLTTLQSSAEQVARVGSLISILALRVAALQASGATDEALGVLLRLLSLAEPEGYLRAFLDAGAPMRRALQVLLATPRLPASLGPVPPAQVSYARTVLAAFAGEQRREEPAQPSPAQQPTWPSPAPAALPLPEPLTGREQEVLRLLAQGASNKEIARHLVVSLATAKKHVANILGKLGAENRTQAVARARSLSLL
jgi:LuxR family maltose regulon positive regulatory protein